MQDEVPRWAEITGACLLLSFFASIGLVAAGGWDWFADFLKSSAPGWLQAVGAIAAVVGTWWATTKQLRHAELAKVRAELDSRIDVTEACLQAVRNAYTTARYYDLRASSGGKRKLGTYSLEAHARVLEILLAKDIPPNVSKQVAATLTCLAEVIREIQWTDQGITTSTSGQSAIFQVPRMRGASVLLRIELRKLRTQRKSVK